MIGRRDKKNGDSQNEQRMLEIDASMQGTLSFKDPVNIVINGSFEGTLDTKGTLVIGESATVKANIRGEIIILKGEMIGDVHAEDSLQLQAKSRLIGDARTPNLSIASGAVIQGHVSMISAEPGRTAEHGASFFSVEELASYLSVEKSLINEWAGTGKLPAQRKGTAWQFDKKKVDEWVASGMIR